MPSIHHCFIPMLPFFVYFSYSGSMVALLKNTKCLTFITLNSFVWTWLSLYPPFVGISTPFWIIDSSLNEKMNDGMKEFSKKSSIWIDHFWHHQLPFFFVMLDGNEGWGVARSFRGIVPYPFYLHFVLSPSQRCTFSTYARLCTFFGEILWFISENWLSEGRLGGNSKNGLNWGMSSINDK